MISFNEIEIKLKAENNLTVKFIIPISSFMSFLNFSHTGKGVIKTANSMVDPRRKTGQVQFWVLVAVGHFVYVGGADFTEEQRAGVVFVFVYVVTDWDDVVPAFCM